MSTVIASITYRSVLGRNRVILLLVMPLLLIGLAAVFRTAGASATESIILLERLAIGAVLPLLGLIAGTGVLASEIDDGIIIYLLGKPISRPLIVVTKLGVAVTIVTAFAVIPTLIAGLLLTDPATAVAFGVGALAGGVAYCAIFLAISTLTRHAVSVGVLYALIWEGVVGGFVPGARNVSVQQWAASFADALSGSPALKASVPIGIAGPLLAVVTIAATLLAGWRLRRLQLSADE